MAKKNNKIEEVKNNQEGIVMDENKNTPVVEDDNWDQGGPLVNKPEDQESGKPTLEEVIEKFTPLFNAVYDEEAIKGFLRQFAKEVKNTASKRATGDPIARIQAMTSIDEVRAAIKVAHAKKSKAKDNPDAIKRYEEELRVAKEKLNELLANAKSDPQALKNMGENISRILQSWIGDKENDLKEALKNLGDMTDKYNLTKQSKTIMSNLSIQISEKLEEELEAIAPEALTIFKDRLSRKDKRVENIIKMQNLVESHTPAPTVTQ